jgi:hypothetical protein
MIYQRPQRLPNRKPDRSSFREKFPKFSGTFLVPHELNCSKAWNMDIRPNTYLIRPYSPEGFTEGGLYVKLNELWARVWGFVLACSPDNRLDLFPGDLIMYERDTERLVTYDDSVNPRFAGEKQPIAIIHEREILAKVEDNLIPTPF